jgi:feruloyl-CoA synthase
MHVGVPVAPISPAYSLMSHDHAKLRVLAGIVQPGAVYVADRMQFARALAALELEVPVLDPARVAELRATAYSPAVDAAFAAVTGDTIAKLLFTSGSTGVPKAVINTQRMLCANQAGLAAGWPFLADKPPVIVDWLPWSHTFGANHNANLILAHGGTLYIDGGKPAPGAFDETLRNLREVPSTIYFNVPRGFDLLVGHLETDAALRDAFFRELEVVFYAAAALSPATWKRLEAVAATAGKQIAMTSAWGSTETSPLVTQVSYAIDRAGVIGVPIPGNELAFVPVGDKLEMRVKGPNVAPGYLRADRSIEPLPLDELGFYPMGDAGRLADDANPDAGVVFEGRVAENFKLASGTWVHVGEVRLALIAACSPHVADAVICGHDRDELGALLFLAPGADREALRAALARHAAACTTSSTRIARVVILAEPASIDAGEITDKGYLNQRCVLDRRASEVERLYTQPDIMW